MESTRSKLPTSNKYPARLHATKVFRELYKRLGGAAAQARGEESKLVLYLEGSQIKYRDDTDRELPFRQESNFIYLSGCDIPGSRIIATCLREKEPKEEHEDLLIKVVLFIPEVDELDVMWSGLPLTPKEVQKSLDVTEVHDMSMFQKKLDELKTPVVHVLPSSSLPPSPELSSSSAKTPRTNDAHLLLACQEARLTKTGAEIDLIQQANDITSRAHEGVMKALGAGDSSSEYEAAAVFSYYCAKKGAKSLAYEVIAASGTGAGTLHYIRNKKSFPSSGEGSLLLLDAGCEWEMYAADITRTFPIGNGGRFTPEAKAIYRLVEEMQDAAFLQIRPRANWEEIHLLMHKVAAEGLLKLGIFRAPVGGITKEILDELIDSGLTTAFFPHGLGHSLGLDVHDSPLASRPNGPSDNPAVKYLRFRRELVEGNVITVEPGIYFNPFLLKPYMDSPSLDQEVLKTYMPVGGVRLEDDILVTRDGYHNFTSVKRSIEAVERMCRTRA